MSARRDAAPLPLPIMRAVEFRLASHKHAIEGRTAPHARVEVRNESAAPYAPQGVRSIVRADGDGFFRVSTHGIQAGDLLRWSAFKRGEETHVLQRWGEENLRRPECTLQGVRFFANVDDSIRIDNVRKHLAISAPGVALRLINNRTSEGFDVVLDSKGEMPAGTKLRGKAGDFFYVHIIDGVTEPEYGTQWATVHVQRGEQDWSNPAPPSRDVDGQVGRARVVAGEPFSGKISFDQPVQGSLGNCWLVAAMSGIAENDPDTLRRLISENPDGTYTVHFQRYDPAQKKYVPCPIVVGREFYRLGDEMLYGRTFEARQKNPSLWFPIIEAAYAKWVGGYSAEAVGYVHEIFEAVYGAESRHIDFDSITAVALWQNLAALVKEKRTVVVNTRPGKERTEWQREKLLDDHAYTLLSVFVRDGKHYVRLRNPYRRFAPKTPGHLPPGTFELPLQKFRDYFCWAAISPRRAHSIRATK